MLSPKGRGAAAKSMNTNRDVFLLSLRYLLHEIVLIRNSFGAQADRVELIRTSLIAQIDRIDALERELKKLIEAYLKGVEGLPPGDVDTLSPVAHNLTIQPQYDDSLVVTIDAGKTFTLPQRLAQVFRYLASGDKDYSGNDSFVGWRSRLEIIGFLEKHTGKTISNNYVNGMVYLLRKALRKAGYNQKLIQTHRQKGVRLAYKYGAQGPPHHWPDMSTPRS